LQRTLVAETALPVRGLRKEQRCVELFSPGIASGSLTCSPSRARPARRISHRFARRCCGARLHALLNASLATIACTSARRRAQPWRAHDAAHHGMS
jgi:hypothetical protein